MAKGQRGVKANSNGLVVQEHYDDSPLPSAVELEKYHQISPEVLPFLLEAARKEQDFRHSYSNRRVDLLQKESLRGHILNMTGTIFAFVIAVLAIITGGYLMLSGKTLVGSLFSGIPIALIIAKFLNTSRKQAK